MSFEKFNASIENFEARRLEAANNIQREIMSRVCSPDQGQECLVNWAEHYGPSFRIIFDEVVDKDPDMLDKWNANPEEREHTIEFFMRELEKLEGPTERAA